MRRCGSAGRAQPAHARLPDHAHFGDEAHAVDAARPSPARGATSASMSAAVASPALTMKFACLSDTLAPPMRWPLRPGALDQTPGVRARRIGEHRAAARRRSAGSPGASRAACGSRRVLASGRARSASSPRGTTRPRRRRHAAIAVSGTRGLRGGDGARGGRWSRPRPRAPGLAAVGARVHRERTADRAGDAGEEVGRAEPPLRALPAEPRARHAGLRAHAVVRRRARARSRTPCTRSRRRGCRRRAPAGCCRARPSDRHVRRQRAQEGREVLDVARREPERPPARRRATRYAAPSARRGSTRASNSGGDRAARSSPRPRARARRAAPGSSCATAPMLPAPIVSTTSPSRDDAGERGRQLAHVLDEHGLDAAAAADRAADRAPVGVRRSAPRRRRRPRSRAARRRRRARAAKSSMRSRVRV